MRARTASIISGESSAGVVLGMQQTLVNPPAAAAAVPDAIVSLCSPPGSRRWTCGSISPGATISPEQSTRSAPGGCVISAPIEATRPPSSRTSVT